MLTLADLSHNSIPRIGELSTHRFIECLLLSHNDISKIEGLSSLRFLQTLDLSYNNISQIEGLDSLPIRELNVSHNRLSSLQGLTALPCLSALDASDNLISSLSPLQQCPHLNYVNVSNNKLEHIRQVEFLLETQWLHVLLMKDNPCSAKEHYRLRVIFRLANLKRLDSVLVTSEEKIRAFNLYRSNEGDLVDRERIMQLHVPHIPFEDYAPQQLPYDDENDISYQELLQGAPLKPFAADIMAANEVDGDKSFDLQPQTINDKDNATDRIDSESPLNYVKSSDLDIARIIDQ